MLYSNNRTVFETWTVFKNSDCVVTISCDLYDSMNKSWTRNSGVTLSMQVSWILYIGRDAEPHGSQLQHGQPLEG